MRWRFGVVGLSVVGMMACGRAQGPLEGPEEAASQESEGAEEPDDGLGVSGLLGTLSQDEIQMTLAPRSPRFGLCISRRWGENALLSGELQLYFFVNPDGTVASVTPLRSTFGDRAAERCLIDVALSTRFPRPHGGRAEFSWSLEVPLDDAQAPPLELSGEEAEVAAPPLEQRESLAEVCGTPPATVTTYLGPDGRVLSAGAIASGASPEQLDCVSSSVAAWPFTNPWGQSAKLTLDLR